MNADQLVAFIEFHGNLAVCHDIREIGQTVPADAAARRREHDKQIAPAFLVFGHRHDRGDCLVWLKRQQIDQRLATCLRISFRQSVHLEPINNAAGREEQNRRMGVADEDLADEILITGRHPCPALAAPTLSTIARKRHALDVTAMTDGNHHVFALDKIFDIGIELGLLDRRPPRCCKLFLDRLHFIARDLTDTYGRPQDIEKVLDLDREAVQFFGDLGLFQTCQALQAQFEDRAGLCL